MRSRLLTAALLVTVLGATQLPLSLQSSEKPAKQKPLPVVLEPGAPSLAPATFAAPVDTVAIAFFDFDDGVGGPDPQGWVEVDQTQNTETYFHVDDFGALPSPPLDGTASMYCGVPVAASACDFVGYGNSWRQDFESVSFPVTGGVTLSFHVRYDSEPGYDFTRVNYLSATGVWQEIASFTSAGDSLVTLNISADSLAGQAKIRFRFTSDFGWSDEDGLLVTTAGAVTLDNIQISDNSGVVDFQDFESEAVGTMVTADGDWTAQAAPGYGDYSALFHGTVVLQEGAQVNNSYFWGFFDNSTADYGCGGFPAQAAVPYGPVNDVYLSNEIWSPLIEVGTDSNGMPLPADVQLRLRLDAYLDNPLDALVAYQVGVRSLVNGCDSWVWDNLLHFSPAATAEWTEVVREIDGSIDANATHFGVGLRVLDACPFFCDGGFTGNCHSHAPLFDNVSIEAVTSGTFVVTNTNEAGPGSLRQAILDANVSSTQDTITFDIPGPGPFTIEVDSLLPVLARPVVIDGTTQPGYAGTPVVEVTRRAPLFVSSGLSVAANADGSVIRALAIRDFNGTNLSIQGSGSRVERCYIGADLAGNPVGGAATGIQVGASNVIVGGVPAEGNLIVDNSLGIELAGSNNTAQSNTIELNNIGIDCDGSQNVIVDNTISGNSMHGIDVRGSDNTISTNTITANVLIGVKVLPTSGGRRNEIRDNVMSGNGIGIDLGGDGVTANDPLDPDTGANELQNYPVITSAYSLQGVVQGVLKSVPNTTFTIDVYEVTTCNASGHGEGETLLGTTACTTNGDGDASFHVATAAGFGTVTATATDADGNTSEFSACVSSNSGIVVSNNNDSGAGSLRQAILDANAAPDMDTITFNIPGAGPHNIAPATQLPAVSQPVIIDGFSEPGALPNSNGPGLGSNAVMKIRLNAVNYGGLSDGLFLIADGITVRGLVVSNAPGAGLAIQAKGCVIEGNYIGTNFAGTIARPNATGGCTSCGGVRIVPAGVFTDPQNNRIGGTVPSSRNIISGNDDKGISCDARATLIQGNFIGVAADGVTILANNGHGILIDDWATECTVGGTDPYHGNVLSGNAFSGIAIETDDHQVSNNFIGTDVSGTIAAANGSDGVRLFGLAAGNVIGGGPGGNTIAYNSGAGVDIGQFVPPGNKVLGNSIHSNGSVGIEIAPPIGPGVPAGWQIAPVITNVNPASNNVSGLYSGPANSFVTIDIFANDSCDPSGQGEGQVPMGDAFLFTGAGGGGFFSMNTSVNIVGDEILTAVAVTSDHVTEFSLCFTVTNTPTGMSVAVPVEDPETGNSPVTVTFDDVTGAGSTTMTVSETGPPPSNSFTFGDSATFYDIDSDAMFNGDIEVCITYDENDIPGDEADLVLLHYNAGTMMWDDITSSLDIVNNELCGITTSLSPFVLAVPVPPSWTNATSAPLDNPDSGSGVAWSDYDGDGDDDLYVANFDVANKLFRNDNGTFVDATAGPLGETATTRSAVWGDYDNDGDRDLYLNIANAANKLLRNDNGTFVDVTTAPLGDPNAARGVSWVDYDNDGDLDIYTVNANAANKLFRNDGGGTFFDVTPSGLDDAGMTVSCAWGDYDNDKDQDLYIVNSNAANKLFRNDGAGAFTDVTAGPLADAGTGRGVAWGDYDNDGDLDIFFTNSGASNKLLRNDNGTFADATAAPIDFAGGSRSPQWVDYDNDGDLDVHVVVRGASNKLFRNDGAGVFVDASDVNIADPGLAFAAAWSDVDADGDLDVYVANASTNALVVNDQAAGNHWLHVDLVGVDSNRDAVGARIRVVTASGTQIREVTAGSGQFTQNSLTAEFGLGGSLSVDSVEVCWPSGTVDVYTQVPADQRIAYTESTPPTSIYDTPGVPREFALHQNFPNPFNPTTTIVYDVPQAGEVSLRIYDVAGRLVRVLQDGAAQPGRKSIVWDGRNDSGARVATGVYFYRMRAGSFTQVRKMVLLK